jgi:hypothetical protein
MKPRSIDLDSLRLNRKAPGPKGVESTQSLIDLNNSLPNGNNKIERELQRREQEHKSGKIQLPTIVRNQQKEEMTLVQKILQEMGCGCGMKKHKTPEEIADNHGKSLKYINKQLKAGIQVESEHTTDKHEAEIIALQHLDERPDYYERLKKVEKVDEAKKQPKVKDKCWVNYSPLPQSPLKKKGNKFVSNCVPDEDIKESFRLPAQNGQLMIILHSWRGKMMSTQLFFPAGRVPTRSEVSDALNKVYPDSRLLSYRAGDFIPDQPLVQVGNSKSKNYLLNNGTIGEDAEAWQEANRKDQTDGMGKKAIKEYRKKHKGSKLQKAVTDPNPTGKDAKRKRDYCRRSKGQMDMYDINCSETPDKKICKARKRWHC